MSAAFVSCSEAAEQLGVSLRLIRYMAAAGEMPCLQLRSRLLIPQRAIDLLLERAMAGFDPDKLLLKLNLAEAQS